MKHIKKFESFDLGRFSEEEEVNPTHGEEIENIEDTEECEPCGTEGEEEVEGEEEFRHEEEDETEEEHEMRRKVWGDEITVERISSFRQFEAKKSKPDFLDLDNDKDKKESMKKAAKDAKDKKDNKKEDKKEDKGGKGLTAAQKKLPEGLRKAIEAKKKK